jgi:glycosyltransferase involved in cell wall biosynthesis
MKSLDIVIPLYRSKAIISQLIHRLAVWSANQPFSTHFIFVDDGSNDQTSQQLIAETNDKNISFQLIKLGQNYGQHTATAVGLFYSSSTFVITMDDDLQHDPNEINKLIDCSVYNNSDLVYASYQQKEHHKLRNTGTYLLKKILKLSGKDYSMVSSFRLMKSHVIQPFKSQISKTAYIDERLLNNASSPTYCNIIHQKRVDGKSGYSGLKLIKMAFSILLFHSSFPLVMISRMGLILSFVFFVVGCYYIYEKIVYDIAIGFTSLIVAIFFSTGLILLSLGTIGEYIRKLWISNQHLDKVIIESHCKK